MGFEKYFTSSGCNCPELNTVKIPLKDGKQYKIQTRDLCRQARLANNNYTRE